MPPRCSSDTGHWKRPVWSLAALVPPFLARPFTTLLIDSGTLRGCPRPEPKPQADPAKAAQAT